MEFEELKARFPSLRPVKGPPKMILLNGCGTRIYGERDRDAETDSYVTTLCFCLLFVPIISLGAYRVVRGSRGWFFLGKEPLSIFAKTWNIILFVAVAGTISSIAITAYTSSPAYQAKLRMEQANAAATKGQIGQAARIYQQLASANADQADNAAAALKELLDTRVLNSGLSEAAEAFAAAARLTGRPGAYHQPELLAKGLQLVSDGGETDLRGANALLDALRPLALDTRDIDKARLPLLKKWVAVEPANVDAAIALASLLEQQDQRAEAKALLLPFKDKLVNTEGARVLGTIYAHDNNYDEAYALLWPYVKSRLDHLHAAESSAESTMEALWNREVAILKNDKGPHELYARLNGATKEQQSIIVREYVNGRIKDDPQLLEAQERLSAESRVVPVTLELGIVMLQRAQGQPDPAARKQQLEAAQDVFLAIRSAAGDTDEYRLFLGQVYYWLGKQADGRKLFDEFLVSKNRSARALISIGNTLRELGSDPEARTMFEESFAKAASPEDRNAAAYLRSLMYKDNDDQIEWLKKCDATDPMIKANLASCLGHKARDEGRDAEATAQFRQAIDAYNAMPRSAGVFNETALAHYSLFLVSGESRDREQCLDCIQQAINLNPSDPILLFNSACIVMDASLVDIVGKDLDLRALGGGGVVNLLRYLYHDQAGRDAVMKRVAAHPGIARAVAYFDKSMVVSPKSARNYGYAVNLQTLMQNEPAVRALNERIKGAGVDTADEVREVKEFIAGANDGRKRTAAASGADRARDTAGKLAPRGDATAACALTRQALQLMSLDTYTDQVDPAEIVRLAQDAQRMAPSSAAHSLLASAYLFRACKDLRRADPAFEQMYKEFGRVLGHYHLLTFVASRPGPLGDKLLKNADFQKAADLIAEDAVSFPRTCDATDWAMLRIARPAVAETFATMIRGNPFITLRQEVSIRLNPANAAETLEMIWIDQVLNKPEDAREVFAALTKLGIPVPAQP